MIRLMNVLIAAAAGLIMAIAIPNDVFPMGHGLFGLLALAPYFLALMRVRRARWASLVGVAFAIVSTVGSNYWLAYFREFSVWTLGGTTFGYMGYHALLAPFLWRLAHTKPHLRPVVLALAWAGYEYLKSIGFFAFPWGLIAFPFNDMPLLIQHVDVTGIWASSFMAAFANAMIAELLHRRDTTGAVLLRWPRDSRHASASSDQLLRLVGFFTILLTIIVGYGILRLARPPQPTDTLKMTLVQQNVDSWLSGNEWPSIEAAQDLTRAALTERAGPPDLIAWSETILRRPFPQNRQIFESRPSEDPFVSFVRSLPAPLLTGAPSIQSVDPFEPVNSAIMLDPKGRYYGFYGKRHLVPMAENIPFWDVPLMRAFFRDVVGVVGVWTPGDRYSVFSIPFPEEAAAGARTGVTSEPAGAEEDTVLRFGTPICYEDSFGYLCREFARLDADVLINLTNNSWSQTRSAQIQHFVASRYRAVENRMALVRSTNSGYTAVVDATGAVIADIPMFEQAYLNVDVPIYEKAGKTVYTQLGDFFARGCILISLSVLVGLFVRDRRRI